MTDGNFRSDAATLSAPEADGGFSTAGFAPNAKRLYDVVFSACGLLVLSPLFLAIAALIKMTDRGAVFYRQRRVGLGGQLFLIWKFRTMTPQADRNGPLVTSDEDARVTRIGRFLRKTKLDELPQLWNVLKGEMSLVGPRPEVPRYVERYTPDQRAILDLRPGITDLASIHFRNEELLLKNAPDVEEFYIRHCLPKKVKLNLEYAAKANVVSDSWIILQTLCPYWICLLSLYAVVLAGSFLLSSWFVGELPVPRGLDRDYAGTLIAFVSVQIGALIWRKQCKGLLSYFSFPEFRQVATALTFACCLLLSLWAVTNRDWPPRNLILVDALLSFCSLSGLRLLLRYWRESSASREASSGHCPVRVGIIGAGDAGSQLALELMYKKQFGRTVVAFFDDDCQKWHKLIHDIPVIGMPECLLEGWNRKLDEVIIAMPEAPANRIGEIGRLLEQACLRVYTAPSVHSLWLSNQNQISSCTDEKNTGGDSELELRGSGRSSTGVMLYKGV